LPTTPNCVWVSEDLYGGDGTTELLETKGRGHWRERVGSLEWKQLTDAGALVITGIPFETLW
jgi:hypothetical protein